jgi:hypothetical protein
MVSHSDLQGVVVRIGVRRKRLEICRTYPEERRPRRRVFHGVVHNRALRSRAFGAVAIHARDDRALHRCGTSVTRVTLTVNRIMQIATSSSGSWIFRLLHLAAHPDASPEGRWCRQKPAVDVRLSPIRPQISGEDLASPEAWIRAYSVEGSNRCPPSSYPTWRTAREKVSRRCQPSIV